MKKYTLAKAVKLCRFLEENAIKDNKGFHFALGGSCLMRGESDKDFDIYVYPESGRFLTISDCNQWMKYKDFDIIGEHYFEYINKSDYDIDKPFSVFEWDGHRIDLFYVSFKKIKKS